MREIKFKVSNGAEQVVVLTVYQDKGDPKIWWALDENDEWFMCSEPRQNTGLKDKNGREIYEGDIYECDVYPTGDEKELFTVVWFDTGLVGKQKSSGNHFGLKHWLDKIEVIGNVYEDGHLLVGRNDENG